MRLLVRLVLAVGASALASGLLLSPADGAPPAVRSAHPTVLVDAAAAPTTPITVTSHPAGTAFQSGWTRSISGRGDPGAQVEAVDPQTGDRLGGGPVDANGRWSFWIVLQRVGTDVVRLSYPGVPGSEVVPDWTVTAVSDPVISFTPSKVVGADAQPVQIQAALPLAEYRESDTYRVEVDGAFAMSFGQGSTYQAVPSNDGTTSFSRRTLSLQPGAVLSIYRAMGAASTGGSRSGMVLVSSVTLGQAAPVEVTGPAAGATVLQGWQRNFTGTGEPGERVRAVLDGSSTPVTTTVGPDGRWSLWMPLLVAGTSVVSFSYPDLPGGGAVTRTVEVAATSAPTLTLSPSASISSPRLAEVRVTLPSSEFARTDRLVATVDGRVLFEAAAGEVLDASTRTTGASTTVFRAHEFRGGERVELLRVPGALGSGTGNPVVVATETFEHVTPEVTVSSPATGTWHVDRSPLRVSGTATAGFGDLEYRAVGADAVRGQVAVDASGRWAVDLDLPAGTRTVEFWFAEAPEVVGAVEVHVVRIGSASVEVVPQAVKVDTVAQVRALADAGASGSSTEGKG
ncbi:hypothetical protein [Cellulomonas triticagri]|uniref:Bacterial Ig domain-containing protein n=1 Tax=Cellulomonas triticagri TaxID=2483352 RepID=A0A3M2JR59_9CELL|nr:hypothetical protein [Cellulomonas triticagri]RMI14340.1 hypothetical protein EBM89_00860 [Cellulomonas triticagri]